MATAITASVREFPVSQLVPVSLLSVDVLRGLSVAGMVLVNFPTDWTLRYHQLGHAEWDGATATDMIFPMFLFLAGLSMAISFGSRVRRSKATGNWRGKLAGHLVTRSVVLVGLGLLLNAFPAFDLRTLHIPGVLQRIALCYLIGGLFTLATGRAEAQRGFAVNSWAVAGFSLAVLVGVWALVRFVPVPGYGAWRFDHNGYLGAVIDRAIFGNRHLSDWGGPARMWDADGLLSCITSIPNLLLGVLTAAWLGKDRSGGNGQMNRTQAISGLALIAVVLIGAALLLNPYLVINRKIWTDSFTLLSSGISLGLFTLVYFLLDIVPEGIGLPRWRAVLTPALIYGSNAILGFAVYSILLSVHGLFPLPGAHRPANWLPAPVYAWLCQTINAYNTSLLYGVWMVLLVCALLWPLYQKRIFLKL
jgi:predicted acyltransferase